MTSEDTRTDAQQLDASAARPKADAPDGAPPEGRGIHVTERAAAEIKRVIAEQSMDAGTCVRVGAKGGGCSGFSYVLDFDATGPTEYDLSFTMHGVTVVVDKKSEFFMGGTILDFNDDELLNRGFVFKNPQATGTCGCGTSFSA